MTGETAAPIPHRSHRPTELLVREVVVETADAISISFEVPAEMVADFNYLPGQFLTLQIPSQLAPTARCYSLASAPDVDAYPKVAVKRTDGGYASNWLCDNVTVGTTILSLPPSGNFTPRHLGGEIVCYAGGSGITPVISIVKTVLANGTGTIELVYANRDATAVIFADELAALVQQHPDRLRVVHWLDSESGYPTAADLLDAVSFASLPNVFICGPSIFMKTVQTGLHDRGYPRELIHLEVFHSLAGDPFAEHTVEQLTDDQQADVAIVDVELDGQVHHLEWPRSQTLVDLMLAKGIDVPYSCLGGECGSCTCTVREGKAEMATCEILDPEDIADGYLLGCQARPVSDYLKIEF